MTKTSISNSYPTYKAVTRLPFSDKVLLKLLAPAMSEEHMTQSPFSDEQMVRILWEADSAPVATVTKSHFVSEPTINAWRKRFGSLETVDVRRLNTVEQDNGRLKMLLAELTCRHSSDQRSLEAGALLG